MRFNVHYFCSYNPSYLSFVNLRELGLVKAKILNN
jgi:hypothetical protein